MSDLVNSPTPRVGPGSRREIGALNSLIAHVAGAVTGGEPPNVFTTLARHRGLFRPWLRFAAALMPRGDLPRRDSELVILRVAWNCDCEYERRQHERLARREGLTAADVERVTAGPAAEGWTPRQAALLRAVDELHERRMLSDELWAELRSHLSETQLIELPMLVGHYEMLAMTLNTLRVEPDEPGDAARGALGRVAGTLAGLGRKTGGDG
jgi:alkylhydroperoxidase family enzyme